MNPETYSIVLHVRRVTIEDAYIAVPVVGSIVKEQPDGTGRIDPEAFMAAGVRISQDQRTEWQVESTVYEPHPIQQPVPPTRKVFDAIVDLKFDAEESP